MTSAVADGGRYDVFVSYAHADDNAGLVRLLQITLRQIGKRWYRRHALRVFRDDSALSASPGLWGSIVDAMGESSWFLLIASPAAAESPWVDREVAHWVSTHGPKRLLVALTDGDWVWDDQSGDFAERTTAVPPSLRGVFTEEPRHIDLRWAINDAGLTARSPRWREQIAELAAPIHGLSKEDLEGTDLREHRRTLRIARTAAAIFAILALTAAAAAVVAVRKADDARRNELRAEAARNEAEFERLVAQARDLRRSQRDLALLLAVEARHIRETPESNGAIQAAILEDPRLLGVTREEGFNGGFVDGCAIPETSLVLLAAKDGSYGVLDLADPAAIRDRRSLVEASDETGATGYQLSAIRCQAGTGSLGVLYSVGGTVWPLDLGTLQTGEPVDTGRELNQVTVSPDGRWIAAGAVGGTILLWPSRDPRAITELEVSDRQSAVGVAFSPDGSTLLTASRDSLLFHEVGSWRLTRSVPSDPTDQGGGLVDLPEVTRRVYFSVDGRRILDSRRGVYRVHSTASGEELWSTVNTFALGEVAVFEPDGATVLLVPQPGVVTRHNASDGSPAGPAIRPSGGGTATTPILSSDGGTLLAASLTQGVVERWALDESIAIGSVISAPGGRAQSASPDASAIAVLPSGVGAIAAGQAFDIASGESLGHFPVAAFPRMLERTVVSGYFLDQLAVTRFDLTSREFTPPSFEVAVDGAVGAAGTAAGEVAVAYADGTIRLYAPDGTELGDPFASLNRPAENGVLLSPDGRLLGVTTSDVQSIVFRTEDGTQVQRYEDRYLSGFSADGTMTAVGTEGGRLEMRNTETGAIQRTVSVGTTALFANVDQSAFLSAVSQTETQLYDWDTLRPVGVPFPSIDAPIAFDDGRRLATNTEQGIIIWDLDPDRWEEAACEMAGRNLTEEERQTYLPTDHAGKPTCPQWPSP